MVLSFALTRLLPDDARFWGVMAFSALGLGCFLLGAAHMLLARRSAG